MEDVKYIAPRNPSPAWEPYSRACEREDFAQHEEGLPGCNAAERAVHKDRVSTEVFLLEPQIGNNIMFDNGRLVTINYENILQLFCSHWK